MVSLEKNPQEVDFFQTGLPEYLLKRFDSPLEQTLGLFQTLRISHLEDREYPPKTGSSVIFHLFFFFFFFFFL